MCVINTTLVREQSSQGHMQTSCEPHNKTFTHFMKFQHTIVQPTSYIIWVIVQYQTTSDQVVNIWHVHNNPLWNKSAYHLAAFSCWTNCKWESNCTITRLIITKYKWVRCNGENKHKGDLVRMFSMNMQSPKAQPVAESTTNNTIALI